MFEEAGMKYPKMGTARDSRTITLCYPINCLRCPTANWSMDPWKVIIGGITTCITLVIIVVIDRYGRKILILGSIAGQLIASIVIGGVLVSMREHPETFSIVAVAFIYVFVFSFQLGVGPIPSFITAELFEVSER